MYSVLIVADDLTGAMDTAQGFASRGVLTTVLAHPPRGLRSADTPSPSGVLSVNTNTRYAAKSEARESVSDVITSTNFGKIYKKIDSTLRGNVAAEVSAAISTAGVDVALFAPAFPSTGRTTEDGIHYVDGTPVAETEYGDDEKGPSSSSLSDLFTEADYPVENVPLERIESGSEHVSSFVRRTVERADGPPVLVCDACKEEHLATVAQLGDVFDVLYVGSGGLSKHIDVPDAAGSASQSIEALPGAPLGVVGSVNERAFVQLGALSEDTIVEVDATALLTSGVPDEAVRRAVERLKRDCPVVLTGATSRETVERTLAIGKDRDLTTDEIRDTVGTGLAETTSRVLDRQTPSGLFVTGGDVAVAVMRSLNASAVRLTGKAIEAGAPVGLLSDGRVTDLPLITKAGGFGERETIVDCLEILSDREIS